eukprot:gnl/TRDRNA2_/TRDRNA2_85159_c0_seq1.p1 gnl/TRDRNA2_/TRDRNA2_85159_c0~~gnl/TRDRNA2_/TRDRNA2_85159_c0_seq1.p1  ORF type:complete len:693 (-),score=150.02 gnl/TRDRNA2_/TRDRNA2_85159_c0_seq1:123-2201(-)
MTDAQAVELQQTISTSIGSNTIEWALNLRICDILQANPTMMRGAMRLLREHLRGSNPVPVMLGLSLLEMIVKNIGLAAVRCIDEELAYALVKLAKKREGWKYGFGRNLNKSMGNWLGADVGIGEGERQLWQQVSQKVLEMLQIWADVFMLQQGELRPIFDSYKQLRREGYEFPRQQEGASRGMLLVAGAEESPAFLASAVGATEQPAPPPADQPAAAVTAATADSGTARSRPEEPSHHAKVLRALEELRSPGLAADDRLRALEKLKAARDETAALVQRLAEDGGDEERLVEGLSLLEEINECLDSEAAPARMVEAPAEPAGEESTAQASTADLLDLGEASRREEAEEPSPTRSPSTPVPPPPSEAPPADRDLQQEMYDAMLARYLQERENEGFLQSEDADAALALRLSLEQFADDAHVQAPPTPMRRRAAAPATFQGPMLVACAQCATVNQLNVTAGGSGLFVCYGCNLTQRVPSTRPRARAEAPVPEALRPARHAPPSRVGKSDAAPELLINAGGGQTATGSSSNAAPARPARPTPMVGIEGGSGPSSEALLGAPVEWSAKKWKQALSSLVPTGSGQARPGRSLGDGGAPEGDYVELGEEGAPLCSDGYPAARRTGGGGSSLWRGLRGGTTTSEGLQESLLSTEEPLIERVRVGDDWELIRPAEDRPYWHNSTTGTSQWSPPSVITTGRRG